MWQMIYISEAADVINSQTLLEILKNSRSYNENNGITGILLYRNNTFIQLLEGCRENVISYIKKSNMIKDIKIV